jgi:sigma-B regulation protein RsbU (phosphoserine phosphatase)
VGDYGQKLSRDKKILELALIIQAREVERRLASPPPESPRIYLSADYDSGDRLPEGIAPSKKHFRADKDGRQVAVPVSYTEQVYFAVRGVQRSAVADDMARLSTMPQAYRATYERNRELMYWQYTSLEVGFHSCYPGHGGYPQDYDPRVRAWYLEAKKEDSLTWVPPMVEVSTRTVAITVSMPVRRPDGSFAGVTAIDAPLSHPFETIQLPQPWADQAETMIIAAVDEAKQAKPQLAIFAEQSALGYKSDWRAPVERKFLTSQDPAEFRAMIRDVLAGKAGVRRMVHRGRESLWAYGAADEDQLFPIVIVPHETIVAQAAEAETYVIGKTAEVLRMTGLIVLAVVVAVVVAALLSSRAVTRPISRLVKGGEKLAQGDFDARVDIRTGDELQELADQFNRTGPMLREREKMKHSLALAMEIQQHLLPSQAPRLTGFDIAGDSIFCDETGGDYYDFIELVDLAPDKLGIAVGDVTGHGIGAALLMASARGVLRSHAGRHGGDLGELFATLNRHLVRDTGDARFMTLFYGVLEAGSRRLSWTSGGHDPALWVRRQTGKIEELANTGIPLGIIDEVKYGPGGPVTLESGDLVVIGTDGIWEASNPAGEMFGRQRLRDLLSAAGDMTADEIHAAVVEAVNSFRGAHPQEDDITLVVIRVL